MGCKGNHHSASFKSLIVAQSLQECLLLHICITLGLLFSWVKSPPVVSIWHFLRLIALTTGGGTNKGILSAPEFIYYGISELEK